MNFILKSFMLLSFFIHIRKFQRLSPPEMKEVLNFIKYKPDETTKKCLSALNGQWYPEQPYYFVYCDATVLKINNPLCHGVDCWENQLTDTSRLEIEYIMNKYRQKVAKGICWKWCQQNKRKLVFELRWDYSLEEIAIKNIKSCDRQGSASERTSINFPGVKQKVPVLRDIAKTSFQSTTGLQSEMRLILWKLISENYLDDWDEKTSQFKRGFMFDVGCAYAIRREVNYVTALNENVTSGNVGHLVCVYQTISRQKEGEEVESTLENCKKIGRIGRFSEVRYYAPLCRPSYGKVSADFLKASSNFCQRGPNFVGNPMCSESNSYSMKTWNEKLYGLTLKCINIDQGLYKVECNMPTNLPEPFEEESADIFNYNCTLKREVVIEASPSTCFGWSCGDSQLTDVTKMEILNQLNEARQYIANGQCSPKCSSPCPYCTNIRYCDITSLRWHWFLEWKASEIVKRCPTTDTFSDSLVFDDGPFPGCGNKNTNSTVTIHFDLPSPDGQLALGNRFSTLFWENAFHDWTVNNEFRRGSVLWIGCSIVVRPNAKVTTVAQKFKLKNGIATHMVCIYAALEKFTSIPGNPTNESCCRKCPKPVSLTDPCNLEYVKGVPPYTNLCTSILLDITMSCQVNYCPDTSQSNAWLYQADGTTIVQNVDGSFMAIPRYANAGRKAGIVLGVFFATLVLFSGFIGALMYLFHKGKIPMKKRVPEKKIPVRKAEPVPVKRKPKPTAPKKLTPVPTVKKPTSPGVKMTKPPRPSTVRPSTVKTIRPSVKTAIPSTVKTAVPSTIRTSMPSTVKTAVPSTVKTVIPSTTKKAALSSVKTTVPSTARTTVPPSLKTTRPSTVRTTVPSTVKTVAPSSAKTMKPTTIGPTMPSTTKAAAPSSVKTTRPSTARTTVPPSLKTTRPSTIRTTVPSTVKTVAPSSAKTTKPTTIRPTMPSTTKGAAPSSVKTMKPSTTRMTIPPSLKTTRPSTIRTTVPSTVKTVAPSSVKTTKPSTIRPTMPSTTKTAAPISVQTTRPSTTRTTIPPSFTTTRPSTIRTALPSTIKTTQPSTTEKPTDITTARPSLKTTRKYIHFTARPSAVKRTRPPSKTAKPSGATTTTPSRVKMAKSVGVKISEPWDIKTTKPPEATTTRKYLFYSATTGVKRRVSPVAKQETSSESESSEK